MTVNSAVLNSLIDVRAAAQPFAHSRTAMAEMNGGIVDNGTGYRRGLGRGGLRVTDYASGNVGPDGTRGVQRYHLYLENGGRPREYVSRVLIMVCGMTESEASSITAHAHRFGSAIVGTWEKELAEYTYRGIRLAGLTASLKPTDDGPMLFGSGHAGEDLWPDR